MRLAEILPVERVITTLDAGSKAESLETLAGLFPELDPLIVHRALVAREAVASTGIGSGVAVPHGRVPGLGGVRAALAVHERGVDFAALDGGRVHLFVVVLTPADKPGMHLTALARVSRALRRPEVRAQLIEAADAEAAHAILMTADAY